MSVNVVVAPLLEGVESAEDLADAAPAEFSERTLLAVARLNSAVAAIPDMPYVRGIVVGMVCGALPMRQLEIRYGLADGRGQMCLIFGPGWRRDAARRPSRCREVEAVPDDHLDLWAREQAPHGEG